jgi:hypothetical protein
MRELLLFIHPTLGVLGILSALWVMVEAFNFDESRLRRARFLSIAGATIFFVTWFSGGLWDSFYYEADRDVMAKGTWALIGGTTMELKEHLFTLVLLLSAYLAILVNAAKPQNGKGLKLPVVAVSGLVVLLGLAMEGAGAFLAGSVHIGLLAGN